MGWKSMILIAFTHVIYKSLLYSPKMTAGKAGAVSRNKLPQAWCHKEQGMHKCRGDLHKLLKHCNQQRLKYYIITLDIKFHFSSL